MKARGPTTQGQNYANRVDDPGLVGLLREYDVDFSKLPAPTVSFLPSVFSMIFPFLIMIVLYYVVLRVIRKRMGGGSGGEGAGSMMGGMMGGVGKSKAKVYNVEKSTGISFDYVAGQDEAKESLAEMIDFL